MEKFPRSY